MSKDRKKLLHIHSSVNDKQPTPATLELGELGVNNAKGNAFISTKNSDGEVVRFSEDETIIGWMEQKEVFPYEGVVRDRLRNEVLSGTVQNINDLLENKSNIIIKLNQVVPENTDYSPYDEKVNGAKDIYGNPVNPIGTDGYKDGAGFAINMSPYAMIGANPSFSSITTTCHATLNGTTEIKGKNDDCGSKFTVDVANACIDASDTLNEYGGDITVYANNLLCESGKTVTIFAGENGKLTIGGNSCDGNTNGTYPITYVRRGSECITANTVDDALQEVLEKDRVHISSSASESHISDIVPSTGTNVVRSASTTYTISQDSGSCKNKISFTEKNTIVSMSADTNPSSSDILATYDLWQYFGDNRVDIGKISIPKGESCNEPLTINYGDVKNATDSSYMPCNGTSVVIPKSICDINREKLTIKIGSTNYEYDGCSATTLIIPSPEEPCNEPLKVTYGNICDKPDGTTNVYTPCSGGIITIPRGLKDMPYTKLKIFTRDCSGNTTECGIYDPGLSGCTSGEFPIVIPVGNCGGDSCNEPLKIYFGDESEPSKTYYPCTGESIRIPTPSNPCNQGLLLKYGSVCGEIAPDSGKTVYTPCDGGSITIPKTLQDMPHNSLELYFLSGNTNNRINNTTISYNPASVDCSDHTISSGINVYDLKINLVDCDNQITSSYTYNPLVNKEPFDIHVGNCGGGGGDCDFNLRLKYGSPCSNSSQDLTATCGTNGTVYIPKVSNDLPHKKFRFKFEDCSGETSYSDVYDLASSSCTDTNTVDIPLNLGNCGGGGGDCDFNLRLKYGSPCSNSSQDFTATCGANGTVYIPKVSNDLPHRKFRFKFEDCSGETSYSDIYDLASSSCTDTSIVEIPLNLGNCGGGGTPVDISINENNTNTDRGANVDVWYKNGQYSISATTKISIKNADGSGNKEFSRENGFHSLNSYTLNSVSGDVKTFGSQTYDPFDKKVTITAATDASHINRKTVSWTYGDVKSAAGDSYDPGDGTVNTFGNTRTMSFVIPQSVDNIKRGELKVTHNGFTDTYDPASDSEWELPHSSLRISYGSTCSETATGIIYDTSADKSIVVPKTISDITGGKITTDCTNGCTTLTGDLCVDGVIKANALYSTSDENLKENIFGIKYEDYHKASEVDLKSFNFKDDETKTKTYGVIAQHLEGAGLGNIVHKDDKGNLSVDYISFLILRIADLENTVKHLSEEIENLKGVENK